MDDVIYLDHNATTPCDPRAVEAMLPFFDITFANPTSRSHRPGRDAFLALESARRTVADCLGAASATEIIFTSGATEANNIAVQVDLQDNLFVAQIQDDGKGFYTYEERFSGESMDGLGLCTIESWAKSINGKVAINSTVGQGTTVTLTVPLQE